jgi:alpha-tubulin suppressor-like RCC1 family protein
MKNRKILLPVLLSIALVFSLILPASMLNTAPVMAQGQVTLIVATDTTASTGKYSPPECDVGDWTDIIQVAAGSFHTVGLKSDGTVVAVGWGYAREEGEKGPCDVGDWANITQVAGGGSHTVGLKTDGTVVAMGDNYRGQCDVGGWVNITKVAAGGLHTLGLKSDGTVVAVGACALGQCEVGNWTDIVQVAAGSLHSVGLKTNGTAVAVGRNRSGECDVGGWTGINQTAAGWHTVGLKSNGTVVAVGVNRSGQCDVDGWTDIIQVAAGGEHTVGLKSGGTVVAVGDNEYGQCNVGNWTDIIQVAAGDYHTVGLKSDGTVVAAGGFVPCFLPTPGCFIATAAYGTPMAAEIEILREFRDEYLLTNPLGQALVGLYYRVSPPMAEFIIEHPSLKPIVRAGLVPAVVMSTIAVNTTPAEKAAILGLLVLVSVALTVWATRRRGRDPERT